MLDLAIRALREEDPERLWPPIITEVLRGCGGDFLALNCVGWADPEADVSLGDRSGKLDRARDPAVRNGIRRCCLLAESFVREVGRTPRTAAQAIGAGRWRRSAAAQRLREALGAEHLLAMPLLDSPGTVRGLLVLRRGEPFTEAHLGYARRIQPLLTGVHKQAALLAQGTDEEGARDGVRDGARDGARDGVRQTGAAEKAPPQGATEPEGESDTDLTPREMAVLDLLGDALTAAAIGRRLGISVRTVHKHAQSIYRKLGTRDRMAAVLRAQSRGLIPPAAEREPRAAPPGRGREPVPVPSGPPGQAPVRCT